MKIMLNLALAAALLLLTGCGSLTARWRGQRGEAYPGVRMDAEHATRYTTEAEWIALFDIPLSAIVDTLFLPYDLSAPVPLRIEEMSHHRQSLPHDASGPIPDKETQPRPSQ